MILVLPSSTGTLSDGTSGMPRQVRNWAPNRLTVGGGTPRRVHSRPKAAMARGWVRKKPGSFHTLGEQVVQVVRGGRAGEGGDDADRHRDVGQQAVVGVVDQFGFPDAP
jgi:hypothetical protein